MRPWNYRSKALGALVVTVTPMGGSPKKMRYLSVYVRLSAPSMEVHEQLVVIIVRPLSTEGQQKKIEHRLAF